MKRQDLRIRHVTRDMMGQGYTPPQRRKQTRWAATLIINGAKLLVMIALAVLFAIVFAHLLGLGH